MRYELADVRKAVGDRECRVVGRRVDVRCRGLLDARTVYNRLTGAVRGLLVEHRGGVWFVAVLL